MSEKKLIWKRDWIFTGTWTAWDATTGVYAGRVKRHSAGGWDAYVSGARGERFVNAEFGKRFVEAEYAEQA